MSADIQQPMLHCLHCIRRCYALLNIDNTKVHCSLEDEEKAKSNIMRMIIDLIQTNSLFTWTFKHQYQ